MFTLQLFNKHSILMRNRRDLAELTKRNDDWAGDAVGHNHGEDTHHPGVCCPELELIGLVLWRHNNTILNSSTSVLPIKYILSFLGGGGVRGSLGGDSRLTVYTTEK